MAKDFGGFQTGRRRDAQGRPLKLISQPASDAYRENWERMFGGKKRKRVAGEVVSEMRRRELEEEYPEFYEK